MKLLCDRWFDIILEMARYQTRSRTRYQTRFQKRVAADPVGYSKWKLFEQTFVPLTEDLLQGTIYISKYLQTLWTIWRRGKQNQHDFHRILNLKLAQYQQKYSYLIQQFTSIKEFLVSNVTQLKVIRQIKQQLDLGHRVLNKFKKVFGIEMTKV